MKLGKYSFGVGDRFGMQGKAQLASFVKAENAGVSVVPVWNKSHREHEIIGTGPDMVRCEADGAVKDLGWNGEYRVDADHIGLKNVDLFIDASDFFTLDVADFIGLEPDRADLEAFIKNSGRYSGSIEIDGIEKKFEVTGFEIERIGRNFLNAVKEAGKIYRHIKQVKGEGNFVVEVSMDESEAAQKPVELMFILAALADEGIPVHTIAPKFTGRFNKGVDYIGDVELFSTEFDQDICVLNHAIREFGLPGNLKLSVHSGSDKFSIYAPIHAAIKKHDAGLHLKTAGTTWLEELIGLAESGEKGLEIARSIYGKSLDRFDELCGPYAPVIDIDKAALPAVDVVNKWSGEQFANALRHDQECSLYNMHFRQLLHVSYKLAAEMGERYMDALGEFEQSIACNVTENIFSRHMVPLFGIGCSD